MEKILLHCPLNISRTLSQMVEDFCLDLANRHDLPVLLETQPHRPDEKSLFKTYVEEGNIPALTIGHVDDFADLPSDFISENCMPLPGRFPLRKELSDLGFAHSEGYIHPFAVVPFAMFYNRNMLTEAELPVTWKDLLTSGWQGKVLMPDAFRIVSVVIKAFLKADFPEESGRFSKNFVQQGSPPEVVSAVDEGSYPIGITNIAFARISRHKNTRIIWPKDGMFCMPQVMVFSKNAPKPILEIGDFLMGREVQDFLSRQSFVGASPEAPLHPLVADNGCCLKWNGWKAFLAIVRGRHEKNKIQ